MNNKSIEDVGYFNLTIATLDKYSSGISKYNQADPIDAEISATINPPLLGNPSDYYASIIRMEVPCESIPICQFLVQTPVTDINKSIWSFTLTYGSVVSDQIFWQFVPDLGPNVVKPPITGTATQQFGPYYWLYDYESIIDIMNTALATAMASLITLQPSLAGTPNPFFYYDPVTTLISLYAPKTQFINTASPPIKIYFNKAYGNIFFYGLKWNVVNSNDPQGLDNVFVISDKKGLNSYTYSSVDYLIQTQNYVSLSYISPLKEIILSSTMNVQVEGTYRNNITNAVNSVQYESILTDFLPDLSGPNEAGNSSRIFIYNAQSLYRIFEWNQKSPIAKMNLKFYWKDNLGNVYPLSLDPGQNVYMKFMFIKKSVFSWDMKIEH